MTSLDEKRVFSERTGTRTAMVAADIGVISVSVSGGRVGEFGLEHRCKARDVCTYDGRTAVATAEDVLIEYDATNHGEAVAVGWFMGSLIAAAPDGTVSWYDTDRWTPIGIVEGPTAIDTELVGGSGGVYRITEGDCRSVGLSNVQDVAVAGVPLAATTDGIYALGGGWTNEHEGNFRAVASGPGGRSFAATGEAVYERTGIVADDSRSEGNVGLWRSIEDGGQGVVDIATTVGLTLTIAADGTLRTNAGDGWRDRALGLEEPRAITLR